MPRPRTALGRLRESYRARVDAARANVAASDPDQQAKAYAALDTAYVSGAHIRARDPEIIRLRRMVNRTDDSGQDATP